MSLTMKHPGTGSIKVVETGWSWSLFLGAGFLGIPLFFRGLSYWGVVMVVAWTLRIGAPFLVSSDAGATELEWVLTALVTGLCLYLGAKGNELSEAHFRACGYEPYRNENLEDRVAARLWSDRTFS
jgi:hypothetical protein